VLFDLDGTLINTAPEFIHIGLQLRAEAGLPSISDDEIWRSVSDGALAWCRLHWKYLPPTPHLKCGGSDS